MGYVDTSVLVSYYCPEPLSSRAQAALDALDELTISPLVELELYSALATKVRTGTLDAAIAGQIVTVFQSQLADGQYRIIATATREYALSRNWLSAFNSPLRTLDALHLAAAFANDLTLITADRVMTRCAEQFGVKYQLIA